jgi:hypothetical protein
MRTKPHHIVLLLTLSLGLAVVSCDDSPTRPSNTPSGPVAPAPPAAVVRLEISGPASIEPGGSAELAAQAIKSDGSVENVTAQAQWTSNNANVLQFTSPGVVKAGARGEAFVNARYANRGVGKQIMVLPSGTFRLNGQITESGLPLDGVTVSVIGGTGEGLSSVTSANGTYTFYGVAGTVRLHAKKEGFDNKIEEVEVTEHRSLNFEMRFNGERGNVSGTYALALEAVGCGSALPESARTRSYVANVEQQGSRLLVRLSGADFIVVNGRGDHFGGSVAHDGRVSFTIGNFFYYYYYWYAPSEYDLVERLNPNNALVVAGTVSATSTGSGISGTLNGMIAVTQGVTAPFTRLSNSCYSSRHGFEMRRQ